MLSKLISIIKSKFKKKPKKQSKKARLFDDDSLVDELFEDPSAEWFFQLDTEGMFGVGMDCYKMSSDDAMMIGATLFMMNSGQLSEYFLEALTLWAGDDVQRRKFASECVRCWRELYEHDDGPEVYSGNLAVNPTEVFNLYGLRPE